MSTIIVPPKDPLSLLVSQELNRPASALAALVVKADADKRDRFSSKLAELLQSVPVEAFDEIRPYMKVKHLDESGTNFTVRIALPGFRAIRSARPGESSVPAFVVLRRSRLFPFRWVNARRRSPVFGTFGEALIAARKQAAQPGVARRFAWVLAKAGVITTSLVGSAVAAGLAYLFTVGKLRFRWPPF